MIRIYDSVLPRRFGGGPAAATRGAAPARAAALAHRLTHLTDGAPVQRRLNAAEDWHKNLFGLVTSAVDYKNAVNVLYDTLGTDSNATAIDEVNEALWVTAPAQGSEGRVAQYRILLWAAKEGFEKGWNAKTNTFDAGKVAQHWTDIIKYTNLILGSGAAAAHKRWKVDAVTKDVPINVVGAAVSALVAVPAQDPTKPPAPKKLQMSLDRHYWNWLDAQSETKAKNTMIRHDVKVSTVYADLVALAREYLVLMGQGKTSAFTSASGDKQRKYLVEGLTGEEPHIFPVSGAPETVDVPGPMHTVLKTYNGAKPKNDQGWDTLVALMKSEGVKPSALYEKMAELKLPQKTVTDLKDEAKKRGVQ